ncbi:winged helix-turn-helix transcriptional regulator [Viscerimonas tarda]
MKTFLTDENTPCPIRTILSRLGSKWSLLVLITLTANGAMRFSDIYRSIGDVSERMLAVTLRSLEADGLVNRTIYPEVPPKVEYKLTKSGYELMPHIQSLVDWALENTQEILNSRQRYK